MKHSVLQQAAGRLKLAERAVNSLLAAGEDPIEFQIHWLDFLVQWKGAYTKVQQAAKDSPQELQWFGEVTKERKADPLLRYLFEARNDGEHGTDQAARHVGPGFTMRATEDITSLRLQFSADGSPPLALGPDGKVVAEFVELSPAESYLIEVTEFDGKKKVPPPTAHLGSPMEPKPLVAAGLGLSWLQSLIAIAEAIQKP